jgi:hypothetical protein
MKLLSLVLVTAGMLGPVAAGRGYEQTEAPKAKNKGTLTLEGKTYQLTSALAYQQTVFKKQEITVILSEKPLDLAKLKQSLQKNGNDDDFFPTQTHVKLSLDDAGELLQLSVHAGGANIIRSGDRNIQTNVMIQNGTAKGTAGTKKADTVRDMPFAFEFTFDVSVIGASRVGAEPKPSPEPKTKLKTKPGTPAQPQRVADSGLRFEGKLTNDSAKVKGQPAQIHQVSMSPGRTYIIDLESDDFDSYLRILDSAGKQLAEDDDSGEGFNARIRFAPPKDDKYQVVATRFGSTGQGNYVLKIRILQEGNQSSGKASSGKASKISEKELRFEGTLAKDSPEVMGKPAQIHRVIMSPDKAYIVDMESTDFDAYLRILDSAGKQLAKDDDSGGNHNARIRFTPPREDNYQVVATRFGLDEGNYLLKIRVLGKGEGKKP